MGERLERLAGEGSGELGGARTTEGAGLPSLQPGPSNQPADKRKSSSVTGYPETPELDKQSKVVEEANRLGEFLDWLNQQGIHLCTYVRWDEYRNEQLTPLQKPYEQLLADFYGIDRNKIEQERRAILAHLREAS